MNKMSVAEMRMLKCISGKTRKDRIRNESIRGSLGITPIGNKIDATHVCAPHKRAKFKLCNLDGLIRVLF